MLAAGLLLSVCACNTNKNATPGGDLTGEWIIREVNGKEIKAKSADETPYLGFSTTDNRIYGNTGCNLLTGSFKANPKSANKLDLSKVGSTRMMCADMQTEQTILSALDKVTNYATATGDELWLLNAQHKVTVRLTLRTRQTR